MSLLGESIRRAESRAAVLYSLNNNLKKTESTSTKNVSSIKEDEGDDINNSSLIISNYNHNSKNSSILRLDDNNSKAAKVIVSAISVYKSNKYSHKDENTDLSFYVDSFNNNKSIVLENVNQNMQVSSSQNRSNM